MCERLFTELMMPAFFPRYRLFLTVVVYFSSVVWLSADDEVENNGAPYEGAVWSGLFIGSDEEISAIGREVPEEMGDVIERFRGIGSMRFANYRLLGEHSHKVYKEYESWVVPSKEIFFKLDSRGPVKGGGVQLAVQLWRDKAVLVKADVVLKEGRPLLIRGPRWGDGYLLISLWIDR